MSDIAEIKEMIVATGESWKAHQKESEKRMDQIESKLNLGSLGVFGNHEDEKGAAAFSVKVDGKLLPALTKNQKLARHFPHDNNGFTVANFVRDEMLGAKASSGPALVPEFVGGHIIDLVRASSRVIEAGALTIPISGPTNLAKITSDPTVYEHTEAAADVSESDIGLVPVIANPKTLAAIIPLTMEVVSDSPNLDQVIETSLSAAFGAKFDALSLAVMLADANIPSSAAGQDPAIWAKVLEAVGAAMALNQDTPSAMISNTADYMARASQLASTAGMWLGKPPVLSSMLELPTTKLTAGTGIMGDFQRGFGVVVREQLKLEVVRYGKPGSVTHLLIATMRAAGIVLQPKRLFIQKKVVV